MSTARHKMTIPGGFAAFVGACRPHPASAPVWVEVLHAAMLRGWGETDPYAACKGACILAEAVGAPSAGPIVQWPGAQKAGLRYETCLGSVVIWDEFSGTVTVSSDRALTVVDRIRSALQAEPARVTFDPALLAQAENEASDHAAQVAVSKIHEGLLPFAVYEIAEEGDDYSAPDGGPRW